MSVRASYASTVLIHKVCHTHRYAANYTIHEFMINAVARWAGRQKNTNYERTVREIIHTCRLRRCGARMLGMQIRSSNAKCAMNATKNKQNKVFHLISISSSVILAAISINVFVSLSRTRWSCPISIQWSNLLNFSFNFASVSLISSNDRPR